ncbi:hypothetical protein U1Q18_048738 [Sarracenia purpurea var. burkii]
MVYGNAYLTGEWSYDQWVRVFREEEGNGVLRTEKACLTVNVVVDNAHDDEDWEDNSNDDWEDNVDDEGL